MGCGSSRVICPKCGKNTLTDGVQLMDHLKQHHSFGSFIAPASHSKLKSKCKLCDMYILVDEMADHLQQMHITNQSPKTELITCPKCSQDNFENGEGFLNHLKTVHELSDRPHDDPQKDMKHTYACPKCEINDIQEGSKFLEHLKNVHAIAPLSNLGNIEVEAPIIHDNKKLPMVGDRVLAMWGKSKWQYFHATIVQFMEDSLRYEINWDDGGTTGRIVDYYNLAVDKVPGEYEIGMGSIILFPQGKYVAGKSCDTGGQRWHQGKVTKIYTKNNTTYYDGVHTKGKTDGKFVTYRDYCDSFTKYVRDDFRVGPNVFDILDDTDTGLNADDVDVYFSSTKLLSEPNLHSTEDVYNPIHIAKRLKEKGLKVVEGDDGTCRNNLMEKVNMMKNSKVFIACICDDYVLNEECRMEFQYAKSTLKKPVVPVVIGNSTEWTMSVVGMLIAGELYIHFKDKSMEEQKLQEVVRSLALHISSLTQEVQQEEQENVKLGPGN